MGVLGFFMMTADNRIFFMTSLVLHLCTFTSHTYAFMRLNVRAAATSHSVVAATNSYIKFESCPLSGPLNDSCDVKYGATKTGFGQTVVKDLVGYYQSVNPRDGCDGITPLRGLSKDLLTPYIAVVSGGNCSFDVKVDNAEKAGFRAAIIYAHKDDKKLLNMSSSTPSIHVNIPSYYVSYSTGTVLAAYSSKMANGTRPSMLLIATRKQPVLPSPPNHAGKMGTMNANTGEEEDGETFGEHYFHICIYIWACVVVSSLIGLSVKWGCCGRSLTRWEVTKIPLKRFRRNSGCEYQDKCPICHEEFHEGRLIRQLPCNHCYHSYCVDRWLVKMSNRCPLCKQRVSVSLFCSWNKQRDSEVLQQSDADLDAEASVGELPPLPPVQTLTPNSLYGDFIMSGPSKFILMRPGKVTRVIEVQKKEIDPKSKLYHNVDRDSTKGPKNCSRVSPSIHHGQYDRNTVRSLSHSFTDPKRMDKYEESAKDDMICMETLHNYSTSVKSSRSSSITSELPLLIEEDQQMSLVYSSTSSNDYPHSDCGTRVGLDGRVVLEDSNHQRRKRGGGSAEKNKNRSSKSNSFRSKEVGAPSFTGNHNVALEVNVNFSQFFNVDVEKHNLNSHLLSAEDACESCTSSTTTTTSSSSSSIKSSSRTISALDLYGSTCDGCCNDVNGDCSSCSSDSNRCSSCGKDVDAKYATCRGDLVNKGGSKNKGRRKKFVSSNILNDDDADVELFVGKKKKWKNRMSYPPSLIHYSAFLDESPCLKESKRRCHVGKKVSSL